jgi:hypothetical protein
MTQPKPPDNIWVHAIEAILMGGTMPLHLAVALASPEATDAWWHQANVVTIRLLTSYLTRGPEAAVRAVQFLLEADRDSLTAAVRRLLDQRLEHPEDAELANRTRRHVVALSEAHRQRFLNVNYMLDSLATSGQRSGWVIDGVFRTLRRGDSHDLEKDTPDDMRLLVPLRALGPPSVQEILEAFAPRPDG